ncbi:Capsule polysaccharide export inner-membrane protein BexC [Burkholderia cepacia]
MRWSSLIKSPFFFLVVIPTLLAGVYFGLVASDIYVSESRFVVRSQDKEAQSGLGALLQGTGFTHSEDSVYVVRDFMQSRDALGQLEKELNVSAMFGAKSVDLVSRFNPLGVDPSFENLYKYYSRRTDIDVDSTSGITTLTVNTFTDSSAYAINGALLAAAERLVNKMNARMQSDLVAAARREVDAAKAVAVAAESNLARYRTSKQVYDPERQSVLQLQQIAKLQEDIVETKAEIAQVKSFAPNNPRLQALTTRLASLLQQSDGQMASIAGGNVSLTQKMGEYSRLQLERTFAERQLTSALATLESARNEALRKQLYVEVVASPNRPDVPIRPHRIKSVLVTFIAGLVIWGIASLLMAGIREHHD